MIRESRRQDEQRSEGERNYCTANCTIAAVGLPQIAPKLVVSLQKPADHLPVPACPDPSFVDTITAQFTAQ
jgi:hypothetical protein